MGKDTARINDQLGKNPETFPILNANSQESVMIEEGPTKITTSGIGHSWIVGSATNGIVGANTNTADGQQQVVGSAGRVTTVQAVYSPNNIYTERFRFSDYVLASKTTANYDVTTAHRIEFTGIQTAQSITIAKQTLSENSFVQGKMIITGSTTAVNHYQLFLSANNGANWNPVTSSVWATFSPAGRTIRYKILSTESGYIDYIRIELK